MLVLNRKPGERVVIGNNIVVTVLEIRSGHVKLGIECPHHVAVHREEVHRRIHEAQSTDHGHTQRNESSYFAEFA
jgi:carbon storage regulator